jgi:hypothetical protein
MAPDSVEVEAPPIAPVDLDAGRPPIEVATDDLVDYGDAPADDVESVAARHFRTAGKRRRPTWSMTALQGTILGLLVLDSILVGWRKDIVRVLPQTASFYAFIGMPVNIRGVAFEAVTTTMEEHEGVPILVVQGSLQNETGAITNLPRLKLAVRNAAKQEIYSWTAAPPRATLGPYQSVTFRTRLASPPPEGGDVLVRFFNRRDLVVDTH